MTDLFRVLGDLAELQADMARRIESSKNKNGARDPRIFKAKNPDIELPMNQWIIQTAEEGTRLAEQINRAMARTRKCVICGNDKCKCLKGRPINAGHLIERLECGEPMPYLSTATLPD